MTHPKGHGTASRQAFPLNETIAVGAILALVAWAVLTWSGIGS